MMASKRPRPQDPASPEALNEAGFYVEHFTRSELADLDHALGASLQGEIGMLRVVIRRFFERAAHEADGLENLSDALGILGLSCTRLARLIHTEQNLQETRAGELGEALSQSLAAVLEEMNDSSLNGGSRGG